jgi:glycosyltransferase involved in cell wall biosynthesis
MYAGGADVKIDVVMITKNSLHPCLKRSLYSIFQNVPLNCLIIVDSFSTDGTIELIKKYRKEGIKIIQKDCKRGKAREIGIKEVSTEWFAFIDSDVILAENWFRDIKKHIKPKVGAIEGNVNNQKVDSKGRAYTNCTLIRTSLVEEIKIPDEMGVLEDQYIRKHIENKGYVWLKVSYPCSIHKSQSDRVKDAFELGRVAGKYRLFPFWKDFGVCFLIPVKYLKYGDSPRIYLNRLLGHIKGILER